MTRIFIGLALLLATSGTASAKTYFGLLASPGLGGSCCSQTAYVDADNASVPSEISSYAVIDSGQYAAFQTELSAPTYIRLYQAARDLGIALTSTGNSALDATYPLDDQFEHNIEGLYIRAGATGTTVTNFAPDGGTTVVLFDLSGGPHVFDAAHIQTFSNAIALYLGTLTPQSVDANGWPVNNEVTIP